MKNKIMIRITTALFAALIFMCGFSIPAYANGSGNFRPKKLSGGLLRRLNIACGIAHAPELIIFDEPTVAVDPQSRSAILQGIRRLNERHSPFRR